jgi:hypothetical protein
MVEKSFADLQPFLLIINKPVNKQKNQETIVFEPEQECIIHALTVSNITQKVINIFRRYFQNSYDDYTL